MTESDEPLSSQDEEVRRLLAESRHTGPTPPDVVARLDRVLDDLAREPDRAAPVVDLARRRRRAASLLVAAAAVVVVGIGVAQVVSPPDTGESSLAGGASRQQEDAAGDAVKPKTNPGAAESGDEPATVSPKTQGKSTLFALRSDHVTDDVTRLRSVDAAAPPLTDQSYGAAPRSAERAVGAACGVEAWGRGRFVPVSYDGTPAVLVLRRPVGRTQVADLFLCGSPDPVRSVTLSAP